jgi:hypothetical protein
MPAWIDPRIAILPEAQQQIWPLLSPAPKLFLFCTEARL